MIQRIRDLEKQMQTERDNYEMNYKKIEEIDDQGTQTDPVKIKSIKDDE